MPDKSLRMRRAGGDGLVKRPVMLAIAGDSAAGKTTMTRGLVEALGPDRCVSFCTDDYHRYDREERKELPFTALHPDCNHLDIMEQHLQLLATGNPVLKPVYDHSTGELVRPELVEPAEFVIVEGLFPLYSKLSRACFDVTVFLDPPEEIRRGWKVARDTTKRGYTEEKVLAELDRREQESAAYIRPQRQHADIVVRFAPIEGRDDPAGTSAVGVADAAPDHRPPRPERRAAVRAHPRDAPEARARPRRPSGRTLHVHGYVPREESLARGEGDLVGARRARHRDPGVPRAPRRRPQRAAGDRPAPAALPPDGRGPVNAVTHLPAAVVFDVDGTLAETERDGHRVAFNEAFAQHGVDLHWDIERYRELMVVTGGRQRVAYALRREGVAGGRGRRDRRARAPDEDRAVRRHRPARRRSIPDRACPSSSTTCAPTGCGSRSRPPAGARGWSRCSPT